MFPRGPRFQPPKPSDVPGPNAYSIPPDSLLDNYKRGAFLEKTERFAKDRLPPDTERYRVLQKKVDDLEKVHLEGKKAHTVELERLRQDLVAAQKSAADNADRCEKQKKQTAVLEARVQELKKASTSDQTDLKDARHKLRILELERDKASSKHSQISDLRKSLAALEAKRKDDLKDRDRRIAELEKLLQAEKTKRDSLEFQSKRTAVTDLEQAREDSCKAASNREDALVEQLEQHRRLLDTVAQQYGALASQSVSLSKYNSLQHDHHALQLRQLRLERKLTNAEGQVVELAHLIRHFKEQTLYLNNHLSTTLEEISFLASLDYTASPPPDVPLLEDILVKLQEDKMQVMESVHATDSLASTYYQIKSNDLHFAASVILQQHTDAQALAEQRSSDLTSALASHEAIAMRLESTQKEKTESEEKLKLATVVADDLRASLLLLETRLAEAQDQVNTHETRHAVALKKEKDAVARLTSTVQKTRIAEDALRAEIEQLTTELTEAERFQEAYYSLSEEVGSLITRNQLAEDEAARISKFNAEILGHNNPAQRIMYVDRIRRELAEAKHKIAQLTREQENVVAQNDHLQNELDMYKSVRIPQENKHRTTITRIGRPPLVNLGNSLNAGPKNLAASTVISKTSYALCWNITMEI
ncbi:hypothetical protein CPB84DRAFT_1816067 [Gymnopilus junonius]|uniref:Hyaluronan-mediated motility receptor C-terminal domain-containing protein n=1 Tax=Gymnopilus junonius TaxID=109634 RepID=A0A9P5TM22_GYMJU|nr:hypothetical protein CPB84DRAFT_1816067 [Gymnopilus junonius]